MTRKDFELIARTIREYPDDRNYTITYHCGDDAAIPNVHVRDLLAELFADALATTNARFDRAGFIEAATR